MCAEQLTFDSIMSLHWGTPHSKNYFSGQEKPQSIFAAKVPPTQDREGSSTAKIVSSTLYIFYYYY